MDDIYQLRSETKMAAQKLVNKTLQAIELLQDQLLAELQQQHPNPQTILTLSQALEALTNHYKSLG